MWTKPNCEQVILFTEGEGLMGVVRWHVIAEVQPFFSGDSQLGYVLKIVGAKVKCREGLKGKTLFILFSVPSFLPVISYLQMKNPCHGNTEQHNNISLSLPQELQKQRTRGQEKIKAPIEAGSVSTQDVFGSP